MAFNRLAELCVHALDRSSRPFLLEFVSWFQAGVLVCCQRIAIFNSFSPYIHRWTILPFLLLSLSSAVTTSICIAMSQHDIIQSKIT